MNLSLPQRTNRTTMADMPYMPLLGCARSTTSSCGCPENKFFAIWEIEAHNIVIIPSLSFRPKELQTVKCILSYEERILFCVLALAHPNTKLCIVTSTQLDPWAIQYYLSLALPDKGLRASAQRRLRLYSVGDPSPEHCLAEKLLLGNESNHYSSVMVRMKQYCADEQAKTTIRTTTCNSSKDDTTSTTRRQQDSIVMMIWHATEYEDRLAKLFGLPYYSASPEQSLAFGTKQGSRSIFQRLGIPCADGTYKEDRDWGDLCQSIWRVLLRNPGATKGVVKLAEGFSGMGNAVLDLTQVQERLQTLHTTSTTSTSKDYSSDVELEHLTTLAFENGTFQRRTWADYREEIPVMGCIFELFIDDDDLPESTRKTGLVTSPSVQGVIDETGRVSVLSTHEQVLDDQVYLGCEFPCKAEYRLKLLEYGKKVGDFLARAGVRDRYGVDFLCVPKTSYRWEIYAVEINLRMTGTTHPWYVVFLVAATNVFKV
jgi:hypothetical protein